MQAEKLLNMDSYIALSWMNTKLRNDYDTLADLCEDINMNPYQLIEKMAKVNYAYNDEIKQWTSIEA